jgi:hypothetical protein
MSVLPTTERFYVVETPMPPIGIDPDLELFYRQAQKFLAGGVRSGELSAWLDLEEELVRLNLGDLRRLGFIRLTDDHEAAAILERRRGEEFSEKDNKFLAIAETLPATGVLIASYTYYFLFC